MRNLKKLRLDRGYTQEELGRLLNVQKSAISKYERGAVLPPGDVLLRLADIFGVSVDELLGHTPPAPADTVTPEFLETLDPSTRRIFDLFEQLPEDKRQEALHYIEYIIARSKGCEGGEPDA